MARRVEAVGDLWAKMHKSASSVGQAMERLQKLSGVRRGIHN
jgi:hypothetical protein